VHDGGHCASTCFHVSQGSLGNRGIGRIDEHGHTGRSRHQFTQEFQPFCRQLGVEKTYSCQVAVRPGEVRNKTEPDRIVAGDEDDGDCRGGRLGG